MTKDFKQISNVFPAGEYYIGDFCYLLDDEDYYEIVCSFLYDGEPYQYKKYNFLFGNTAHGDGQYSDNKGNSCYSADSGTIGIINLPTKKLKEQAKELLRCRCANVVKFDEPFSVYCGDGIFYFGSIEINTEYSKDEDYEDD